MTPKSYPSEKYQIIAKRGRDELDQFVKEIPHRLLAQVSSELPAIDGYRPGLPATFYEQARRVLKHMKGPKGVETTRKAAAAFLKMWIAWTHGHEELNKVLLAFDNGPDFPEDGAKPPNTPLDVACFDALVIASGEGKVSREEITRFYEFGYFLPDPAIEAKIAKARPRAELEELRKVLKLPDAVEELKHKVQALAEDEKHHLEDVRRDMKAETRDLRSVMERIESLEATRRDAGTRAGIEVVERGLKKVADDLELAIRRWEVGSRDLKSVTEQVVALEASRRASVTKADLETAAQRIADLAGGVGKASTRLEAVEMQLKLSAKSLADLEGLTLKQLGPQVRAIAESLASLATRPESPGAPGSSRRQSVGPVPIKTRPTGLTAIETLETCLIALTNNFMSIGLTQVAARGLSQEITAAAFAGQIPMLAGSVASVVAEMVVVTLAAQSGVRICIPVGLLSGEDLDHSVAEIDQEAGKRESITVVVLEGLNRSAVEAYGESLSRIVANRVLGLGGRERDLFIVGTLVEGPSALPISPPLTELGPILHTDVLHWRSELEPGKPVVQGSMRQKAWEKVIAAQPNSRPDRSQFDDCMRAMAGPISLVWQRGLEKSFRRLSAMIQHSNPPSPLQSLVYGWLIPRAYACGIPKDRLQQALGEGRPSATGVDPRVMRLLGMYWPDAGGPP